MQYGVIKSDNYLSLCRTQLAQVFDLLQEVNVLDSQDPVNLGLLGRPDLNVTFTKLHCWRLTQFDKAVFLDADTLVSIYTYLTFLDIWQTWVWGFLVM